MRLLAALLAALGVVALAGVLAGCGGDDESEQRDRPVQEQVDELRGDVEEEINRARDDFEEARERFGRRIREILQELERVFDRPDRTSPTVRSRGRNEPQTIDAFLTDVIRDVDQYWTKTFAANDLPEPSVKYDWVAPQGLALTACGGLARDSSAFYCPADDTIYVGQQFAADVYRGVAEGFPGQEAGHGRAAGDFAVAYVLAHEYAHNLQQELGVFDNTRSATAKPYELQADCLAGTWAFSVHEEGELEPGDLQEATDAALAVGDFDRGNEQHHGTPEERRDALLAGYESGEPSSCERYVPS